MWWIENAPEGPELVFHAVPEAWRRSGFQSLEPGGPRDPHADQSPRPWVLAGLGSGDSAIREQDKQSIGQLHFLRYTELLNQL